MKNVVMTPSELKALEERRSELGAIDCSIEQKNRHISGIRDYKHVEYGMTQYGLYQALSVKGSNSLPPELTGTFTDPRQIIRIVDTLIKEGKLIEPK